MPSFSHYVSSSNKKYPFPEALRFSYTLWLSQLEDYHRRLKNSTCCILTKSTKIAESNNLTSDMPRRLFLDFRKPSVHLVYRFWHNLEKRATEKICDKIQNWHGALSFQPALRSKGWVLQLRGEAAGSRRWSCTCYTNCITTLNGSPSLEKK